MRKTYKKSMAIKSLKSRNKRIKTSNHNFICEKIFLLLKKIEIIFEKVNFSNFFLNLNFHEKNFYFLNEKIISKIFIIMKVVKKFKKIYKDLFLKFLKMKRITLSLNRNVLQLKFFFEDLLILNMDSFDSKHIGISTIFISELGKKVLKFQKCKTEKYKISQMLKNTLCIKINRFCPQKTKLKNREVSNYLVNQKYSSKNLFFLFLKSKKENYQRCLKIKNFLLIFLINKNSYKLNKIRINYFKNYEHIQSHDLLGLVRFLIKNIKKVLDDMKKKKILKTKHNKKILVSYFYLLGWINVFFSWLSVNIVNTIFLIKSDFFRRITILFSNLSYKILIVKGFSIICEPNNTLIMDERNNEIKKEFFFLWKEFFIKKPKYSCPKKKKKICNKNIFMEKEKGKLFCIIKSLLARNKSLKKLLYRKIDIENKYHQKLEEIRGMESDLNLMLDSKFH